MENTSPDLKWLLIMEKTGCQQMATVKQLVAVTEVEERYPEETMPGIEKNKYDAMSRSFKCGDGPRRVGGPQNSEDIIKTWALGGSRGPDLKKPIWHKDFCKFPQDESRGM